MGDVIDALAVERVAPGAWRAAVEAARSEGWRFVTLHAAAGEAGAAEARVLLARGAEQRLLACPAGGDGAVPTLVDLAGAAEWDEREAHDLHGLRFSGHEPLRPLVHHDPDPAAWTVPVTGDDIYQVAVGPIHAGVIESGHFRFHLVGEKVIHLDIRLFHKHRGLERAAEGSSLADGLAYAQRACAACAVTNSVAYAHACESLLGLWPDPELSRARTLALELERLWNHVQDIGAVAGGVGFAAGGMAFLALKERAQRLNAQLAGHRFLFDAVGVGEGRLALDAEAARAAREEIRSLRTASARAWRAVLFNGSVQDRLDLVGIVGNEDALRLGTCGPGGRASGIHRDTRTHSPRLHYPGFTPARPETPTGDVQRRLELREAELAATFDILDELLAGPVPAGSATRAADPAPHGIGAARVESPRGETAAVVEAGPDGALTRLHLRTGSCRNWPSVAQAAQGLILADFPLVNKSFELCYACADR